MMSQQMSIKQQISSENFHKKYFEVFQVLKHIYISPVVRKVLRLVRQLSSKLIN